MTQAMLEPIVLYDGKRGSKKRLEEAFRLAESEETMAKVRASNERMRKMVKEMGLEFKPLTKEESDRLWNALSNHKSQR